MNTIVTASIAVLVLLVVIIIFMGQIKKPSKEFRETGSEVSVTKCEAPLLGRHCSNGGSCGSDQVHVSIYDKTCGDYSGNTWCCATK